MAARKWDKRQKKGGRPYAGGCDSLLRTPKRVKIGYPLVEMAACRQAFLVSRTTSQAHQTSTDGFCRPTACGSCPGHGRRQV